MQIANRKRIVSSPSFLIFVITFSVYCLFLIHDFDYFGGPRYLTGDEPHYIIQAENLVVNHSMQMEKMYGSPNLNPWVDVKVEWHASYENGHWAANHGWGLPILLAVPYYIGSVLGSYSGAIFGANLMVVCITSLVNVFIYKNAQLVTKKTIAAYTSLIFAFCTLIFLHSKVVYSDMAMGLMILVALYSIFKKDFDVKKIIIAGMVIPYGVFLKNNFAVIGIILFALMIIILLKNNHKKLIVPFLIPLAAVSGLYLLTNYFEFGNFITPTNNIEAWADPFDSLGRLFFDRYYGLIIFSPVVLFSVIGFHDTFKKNRGLLLTILLIMIGWIVPLSFVPGIGWGADYPARYLTTIIPLMAIPFAVALEKYGNRRIFHIPLIIFSAIGFYLVTSLSFQRWNAITQGNSFSITEKSELVSRAYLGLDKIFPALYGQNHFSYNWNDATIFNIAFIIATISLVSIVILKPVLCSALYRFGKNEY